jgi:hypothetical protein
MEGWKIVAARRAVARMIDTLDEPDLFCVLTFDSVISTPPELSTKLAAATDRNRFRAVEYLATLGARGGTEMAGPLDLALNLLAEVSSEERDRVLVLITDGQIGNEDQILSTLGRRLKDIRVFTLGIDQAVNEGFLRRLVERGGGSCELVESEERLDEVMQSVHRRIATPILTGLFLEGHGIAIEPGEVVPRRLPDLFSGSPILILGRYRGRGDASLAIRATDAAGQAWSENVPAEARDNPAIAAAWARGQIRQIEDRYAARDGDLSALERTIVSLSLKFQVLCRFTAYVAIDRSQAVNLSGSLHCVTQPVEMPSGWAAPLQTRLGLNASLSRDVSSRFFEEARLADHLMHPSLASESLLEESTDFLCIDDSDWGLAKIPGKLEPGRFALDDTATKSKSERLSEEPIVPMSLPQRFQNGEPVSRGGMGAVYKAFDRDRGMTVCVKVISAGLLGPEVLERWRLENDVLKRLKHTALTPALEIGCSEGTCWVVMPFITGQSLAERLHVAGPMPYREAAMLVAELAEALQLAHEQGLAHGDLKPVNICLGDDGQARLIGFDELPLQARSDPQVIVGTPAYMAPERIRGEVDARDPGSEVYALGILLYQALTGETPFSGATTELLAKILNEKPKRPRRLVRSVPAALEAICLKAMAKDRTERYATAGELAAALRRFLTPAQRKRFWKSS